MANVNMDVIKRAFWPRESGHDVWMIVDGARDRRIYGLLLDTYLNYTCLYQGDLSPEIEVVAPYLVQLEYGDSYGDKLIERAWGSSWGLFLKCDSSMESLRRHLRTLLTVKDQRGNMLLFRYYDPRVMRVYLPTCFPEELKTVYGPINRFWMEDEDPNTLLEFRVDHGKLVRTEIALDGAGVSGAGAAASIV
jgi:hypothetical protein